MILFGDILTEVVEAMRAQSSPEKKAKARRRLNADYRALAAKESWDGLRTVKEYSWSGSAIQLPANLQGIDLVWDDDNYIQYLLRNRADIEGNTNAFLFYTYQVGSYLAKVEDGAFAVGEASFDSPNLETASITAVGEFFYVDGEEQLYEITEQSGSLFTFTPEYKGEANTGNAVVTVRPPSTLMLDLRGPYDADLPTTSIQINYWKKPDTLLHNEDIVYLPTADVLTWRSLSRLPEAKSRRPVTQSQAEGAFQEAAGINPDRPTPRVAKGYHGRAINFGANYYGAGRQAGSRSDALKCRMQR